jgi:PHD/YefM family antitoxin component YafN of YafNO toxin-antitoxin module
MKSTELEAFERFWDHVSRAEQEIRENPCSLSPANRGDPLEKTDEEFLQAYKKIKPHLAKFRRKRLFFPPTGLMLRSGPYHAETAHEALMLFLIKPNEYESAYVLSSQEYLSIKEEAQAELKNRQEALEKSAAKLRKTADQMAREERDRGTLLRVILDHMLKSSREDHPKPLIWKELQDRLPKDPDPWCQSRITRTMAKLLDAPRTKGMTTYRELFRNPELKRGFIIKNLEGQRGVDVEVEDSLPDD